LGNAVSISSKNNSEFTFISSCFGCASTTSAVPAVGPSSSVGATAGAVTSSVTGATVSSTTEQLQVSLNTQ
jgi:S-formylglutathione hydrolase FrmB